MATSTEEFKNKSYIKMVLVVVASFVALPLLIALIMYFSNNTFKNTANEFLSGMPGVIGTYFKSQPTREEEEQIKRNIAKHYIGMDEDRIIDKLLIIKAEDNKLHNELVILMSRENPKKMKYIKEQLRNAEVKKDLLQRMVEEMKADNEAKIKELKKYYTSLSLSQSLSEIERTYSTGEVSLEQMIGVFEQLKDEEAARYLYYLDEDLKTKITYGLSNISLRSIEKKMQDMENKEKRLLELAGIYSKKSIDEGVAHLASTEKYNLKDLSYIYINLPLEKAGEILANVEEDQFIMDLLKEINELENITRDYNNTSEKISQSMTIFKEYEEKTKALVSIYQKMNIDELAKLINDMLKRNQTYQKHKIDDQVEIAFTEEQLVIDILRKLKPATTAEILKQMKESTATEISKKLMK